MSAGLPVVSTRVGGIPELVKHGENGLLVEADSSRELRDALTQLSANAPLAKSLAARAQRDAAQRSWRYQGPKLLQQLARA